MTNAGSTYEPVKNAQKKKKKFWKNKKLRDISFRKIRNNFTGPIIVLCREKNLSRNIQVYRPFGRGRSWVLKKIVRFLHTLTDKKQIISITYFSKWSEQSFEQ